jgi:G3E family GTPase
MNVIILSGFLGAGKTSLLLQLAAYLTQDAKVAILENEIGKISVDGTTLKARGIEVRELFSGCVCCTLTGELSDTVRSLQEQIAPDWLIIEATGLAYPDKAAAAVRASATGLGRLRVLVLADAARFLALEKISPLVAGQPESADVILLNKVDLVDEAKKTALRARLHSINATAKVLEVVATEPIPTELWQEVL